MLCTRCKKRQAVVFVQRLENGKPVQEGYCLTCARELHIQPVDDLMKRFNMTDDQLASMEEHMADLMQQAQESGAMMPMMDGDMQNPDDTGDDFVRIHSRSWQLSSSIQCQLPCPFLCRFHCTTFCRL